MARHMGIDAAATMGDLLALGTDKVDQHQVEKVLQKHATGLRLLCAPTAVSDGAEMTVDFASSLLQAVREGAEFVLLDISSSESGLAFALADQCSAVLLVLEPTPISLDAARPIALALKQVASGVKQLGCVIVNRSGIASSISASEITAALGLPVVASIPRAGDPLASAYRSGQLIIRAQPEHEASQAFHALAASLRG
jgi:pilus assembly protein CpaE